MNKKMVVIIVSVSVLLGGLSLIKFGSFIFIIPAFIYFTNWLHNELRIDMWLARAIVAFLLAPFILAIKESVAVSKKRRTAGLLILGVMTGMFFLVLFVDSATSKFFNPETGEAVKWYAETSEGIRLFDENGYDPKYGKELKPVTEEVIEKYEKERKSIKIIPSATEMVNTFKTPRAFSKVREESLPTVPREYHQKALEAGWKFVGRETVEQINFSRWIEVPGGYDKAILFPKGWVEIQQKNLDGILSTVIIKDGEFIKMPLAREYRVRGSVGAGRMIINLYQRKLPE